MVNVMVNPNPSAAFSFLVNSGTTYDFSDMSSGNPVTWFWDFGDGTFSNLPNPQHTFPQVDSYFVCLTVSTLDSCSDTFCQIVPPDPTSTESPRIGQIKIWPNPGLGLFNLEVKAGLPGPYQVRVYDARGKMLWVQYPLQGKNLKMPIDLSSEPSGMYLLEISGRWGRHTQRLVVER